VCNAGVDGYTHKWLELVFGVRVTTEDIYFVFNGGLDLPVERLSFGMLDVIP